VPRLRIGRNEPSDDGVRKTGTDALHLVVDYVKQETLSPFKGLGRFLLFGIVGSIMLCAGLVLLLVALLRVIQTETGTTFAGNLTWLPYVIVGAAAIVLMALAGWRIAKGGAARRRPTSKQGGSEA
jgi:hypothetical protein